MNKNNIYLLFFYFYGFSTQASEDFKYSYNFHDGFKIAYQDSSIALKGRLQYDIVNFQGYSSASQEEAYKNTTDHFVRRGNIGLTGKVLGTFPYETRMSYDRKDHSWDVDRAWLGYTGWEPAQFFIGRNTVEWGLEGTTSSSWITSNERPILFDLTSAGDQIDYGFAIRSSGTHHGLSVQTAKKYYSPSDQNINTNWGYYGRATYAPILKPNQVLHLGLNYHDSRPNGNDTKISTRLETRTDQDDRLRLAEINHTAKDWESILELAYQQDSLRLQSEYFYRTVKGEEIKTQTKKKITTSTINPQHAKLHGGYVQVSYLFGSDRKYDVEDGKWGKPNKFNTFEPFYRFEYNHIATNEAASKKELNQNVKGVQEANRNDSIHIKSSVLGVNYFYNQNLALKLSYAYSKISNIDTSKTIQNHHIKDTNHGLTARIQYIF